MLRKLSSYYRVPLLYFFDTDPVEDIVVRRDERKIISSPRAPITYEMLQHDVTNKKMECSIMKLAPHYSDPDGVYASYPGEECFLVLSGAGGVRAGRARLHAQRGRQHILRKLEALPPHEPRRRDRGNRRRPHAS